jgi:hypothetical protein
MRQALTREKRVASYTPWAASLRRIWRDPQEVRSPQERARRDRGLITPAPPSIWAQWCQLGPRRPARPLRPHVGFCGSVSSCVCVLTIQRCDPQEMRPRKSRHGVAVWEGGEPVGPRRPTISRRVPVPRNTLVQSCQVLTSVKSVGQSLRFRPANPALSKPRTNKPSEAGSEE